MEQHEGGGRPGARGTQGVMSMQRIVVLGGAGDGFTVAEAVRQAAAAGRPVSLFGFLNDAEPRGTILQGVPVLGRLEDWRELDDDVLFIPAIQKVKAMPQRVRRLAGLAVPETRWARVIHPSATTASDARIGAGAFIGPYVTVQPGAVIGHAASVRAGANIGHDAQVGDQAYVGPNATLCGRAVLGTAAHLGPNAVIVDRRRIGDFAVVGAGAVATKDIEAYTVVMGNPAQRVGLVPRCE